MSSLDHLDGCPPDRGLVRRIVAILLANRASSAGTIVLSILVLLALLGPILAPYDPNFLPEDTPPYSFRAPLETVTVFGHRIRGEIGCTRWEMDGDHVVLHRGETYAVERVPLDELGEPARGWLRGSTRIETLRVGDRELPARRDFHLLGTDGSGRDLLSRILHGAWISLAVGFAAMAVAMTLGTVLGALAGYFGGIVDAMILRLVDIFIAFPRLVLLLLLVTAYGQVGIGVVVLVLGATGWMGVTRLVRAEFLKLRELDFTVAARALGAGTMRTIFRHLLPNALGPIVVAATLRVGDAILLEAALSFLGFGIPASTPTWGNIIHSGRSVLTEGVWWVSTLPGLLIVATVLSVNVIGETLRAQSSRTTLITATLRRNATRS
jgi:peptide/nickel transport system permease protein